MDENKYYVYAHVRKDNGNAFYIGKGSGNRAWEPSRNERHDLIRDKYGMSVCILKENMSEEAAYQAEYDTINEYLNNGYGIDIVGLQGNDEEKFLTNQTFGSRGSIGVSNPMYNVSPKERMDEETYKEWLEKTTTRLCSQVGDKNPNWNNHTLHDKVKDNPELRMQYYSRPGRQNGRCRRIALYDLDWNYITEFDYIGECASYIKEIVQCKGSEIGIRQRICTCISNDKPCYGYNFKYLN